MRIWKLEEYPAIAKRAKAENAIIYWADETAVRHDTNWVTGYSPIGQTPILECYDGRWKTATMVSAIYNQGLLRFKVQDKPLNQEDFIAFMRLAVRMANIIIQQLVPSRWLSAWMNEGILS